MKNITFIILSFIFLFSCSSYNTNKTLDLESAQLAHSKFSDLNNNFLYEKYKLLIIEYGKNSTYPDINEKYE